MLVDHLLRLMDEQGMDQQALATAAGCSQVTISKISSGQIRNSRFLPQLAAALGVNVEWLRGTPGIQRHMPPPVQLPGEEALCLMFKSLLIEIPRGTPIDHFARTLARRFPSALAAVQQVTADMDGGLELVSDHAVHAIAEDQPHRSG